MALVDLAVGARIRDGLAATVVGPFPLVVTTEFLRRDIMVAEEVAMELGPDGLLSVPVWPARLRFVEVEPKPFIDRVDPPP